MVHYSRDNAKGMILGMHKTKHSVKILSGNNAGAVALFDGEEDARAEAIYMQDQGVCVIRRGPLYVPEI